MVIPVILAGGSGSQLWPLSREIQPKQFQIFQGGTTPLQDAALRLASGPSSEGVEGFSAPIVVCLETHRFIVAEQLRSVGVRPEAILLEPSARGSSAAAAAGVWSALSGAGCQDAEADPVLLLTSSDLVVADPVAFGAAVRRSVGLAAHGKLVVFGVAADRPLADLGYLLPGASLDVDEHPTRALALGDFQRPRTVGAAGALCEAGWMWNAGMFVGRASLLLDRLGVSAEGPIAKASSAATRDLDFTRLAAEPWSEIAPQPLDIALLRHPQDVVIVPLDAGWGELGSWASAHAAGPADGSGNRSFGDVVLSDVRGSYVRSNHRLVVAVGVADLAVVETADAVMVAPLDRAQELREVVGSLVRNGREEAIAHRKVLRPWGSYEGIDRSEGFQVKRITVLPGASLSLQLHHRRSEHWVIVRGKAWITRGEEQFLLHPNQSTYIPIGVAHRLENRWDENLEMIEVQCGEYLGEDDIVRLEDRYGRVPAVEGAT